LLAARAEKSSVGRIGGDITDTVGAVSGEIELLCWACAEAEIIVWLHVGISLPRLYQSAGRGEVAVMDGAFRCEIMDIEEVIGDE